MDSSFSGMNKVNYADTYDATSSALTNKLNNTNFAGATDDELMEVCKDFESYFIEQVLKSMEKMTAIPGEEEGDGSSGGLFSSLAGITGESDAGMSTLGSYFGDEMISQYAKTLTSNKNGEGLGLAQTLYEQMKRNYTSKEISDWNTSL